MRRGFTLIELLVVIAIIGLLSSIVLSSLGEARTKGRIAKTQEELWQIRNAVELMVSDTGRYPLGYPADCNYHKFNVHVASKRSGLAASDPGSVAWSFGSTWTDSSAIVPNGSAPTAGFCASGQNSVTSSNYSYNCSANDGFFLGLPNWNGPYVKFDGIDPWGGTYSFQSSYQCNPCANGDIFAGTYTSADCSNIVRQRGCEGFPDATPGGPYGTSVKAVVSAGINGNVNGGTGGIANDNRLDDVVLVICPNSNLPLP